MGVDRVIAVDLHGGQIEGFFGPSVPVENLQSMPIGALYFSEKHLRKPVIVAASAGGVLRAKKFRETLVEQGIDSDMAMLIESREEDEAGRFGDDSSGKLDLVGNVKGCDCILIEVRALPRRHCTVVNTTTTVQSTGRSSACSLM
jgi:ribose-phosphate pyrophosphokinase